MRKIVFVVSLVLCLTFCTSSPLFLGVDKKALISNQTSATYSDQCGKTIYINGEIPDQFVEHQKGSNLNLQLKLSVDEAEQLYWTKDYGPDGVVVNPASGCVTWDIDDRMPSESFHVGLNVYSGKYKSKYNFIVHAGVSQVLTVGASGGFPNIKAGMSKLKSGGTLVLQDGEYRGDDNYIGLTLGGTVQQPASGNTQAYTTIMAKNPGKAVLTDGAYVRLRCDFPVSYVAFKGLYVVGGQIAAFGFGRNKEESNDRCDHLKFVRNGVQADTDMENTKSPFNIFRSDDVLFENNYAFGGGRYKFTSYEAENIVWRRNVARYDVGTFRNEPKGTYGVYATKNAFLGNNLAVDGDHSEFINQGELAGEFTTPTTSGDTIAKFERNMQINSEILFGNMDEQISGGGGDSFVEHRDNVSWDVRPYQYAIKSWGSAWFDHMTMGHYMARVRADEFFFGYHDNTRGITNSILHGFNNGDMFYGFGKEEKNQIGRYEFERYGVDTVNLTEIEGKLDVSGSDLENITDIYPLSELGGLRYLTRVEAGSLLSSKAKDSGNLGATVMNFIGSSGTLYGESGFDTETYIPMWPFPMEDLIKEKFAQLNHTGPVYEGPSNARNRVGDATLSGERGFAVEGEGLSNYIWAYLGNLVPPLSVAASSNDEEILVQWAPLPQSTQGKIRGYKVWRYNEASQKKELVEEVGGDTFSIVLRDHDDKLIRYGVSSYSDSQESTIAYWAKVLRYKTDGM